MILNQMVHVLQPNTCSFTNIHAFQPEEILDPKSAAMQVPSEGLFGSVAAIWRSDVAGLGEPNQGDWHSHLRWGWAL